MWPRMWVGRVVRSNTAGAALPTKNGVGASTISLPVGPWKRVIDFLAERFPHIAYDELVTRMARGDVLDHAGARMLPDHAYRAREKLYYYRDIPLEPRIPFDEVILFQDEHIVVVDKPHFLPVAPVGRYVQETVLVRLKRKLGIDSLAPMHRIDRETAGLVLFTVQPDTRGKYQSLFEHRAVQKSYEAIAPWRGDLQLPLIYRSHIVESDAFMQMREVARDQGLEFNAETRIELLEVVGEFARYLLTPLTGKKHQLRVQMAALGMPILHDQIYPVHQRQADDEYAKPLQLLAKQISFRDPISGEHREFESQRSLHFS
jgi:tRNA pseudouridine32 synthase / 23S rRNA pseudouridine746 synthase